MKDSITLSDFIYLLMAYEIIKAIISPFLSRAYDRIFERDRR